jgi:fructokinase
VTCDVTFDRDLWRGSNRLAVAWRHTPLGWPALYELDDRDCWCGQTGCLESFISANGVEADYRASALAALTVDEIISSATKIDMVAQTVLQVLHDHIGRATVVLISLL